MDAVLNCCGFGGDEKTAEAEEESRRKAWEESRKDRRPVRERPVRSMTTLQTHAQRHIYDFAPTLNSNTDINRYDGRDEQGRPRRASLGGPAADEIVQEDKKDRKRRHSDGSQPQDAKEAKEAKDINTKKGEIFEYLQEHKLFNRLQATQLLEIVAEMHPKVYKPGDIICRVGQKMDKFYVIYNGQLSEQLGANGSKDSDGELLKGKMNMLQNGDCVGEQCLTHDSRSSVTVTVQQKAELWSVAMNKINAVCTVRAKTGTKHILRTISARMTFGLTPPAKNSMLKPLAAASHMEEHGTHYETVLKGWRKEARVKPDSSDPLKRARGAVRLSALAKGLQAVSNSFRRSKARAAAATGSSGPTKPGGRRVTVTAAKRPPKGAFG